MPRRRRTVPAPKGSPSLTEQPEDCDEERELRQVHRGCECLLRGGWMSYLHRRCQPAVVAELRRQVDALGRDLQLRWDRRSDKHAAVSCCTDRWVDDLECGEGERREEDQVEERVAKVDGAGLSRRVHANSLIEKR
jgi:hypothetical protein